MVTVKQRHCSGRKTMMTYGEDMIAQQSSSDVSIDPNEWSHSWSMGKPRKTKQKSTAATVQRGHCAEQNNINGMKFRILNVRY